MPKKGYRQTEEHKAKMRAATKGKPKPPFSDKHRANISAAMRGKTRKGKRPSAEHNEKNRIAHLGKVISDETKMKIGAANKGKTRSREARAKMSAAKKGDKCIHWKGGVSFAPYCYKFDKARRIAARSFFGNYCIVCGKHRSELNAALSVHHIDHDKEQGCSGKPFNLVPMCKSCHAKELYDEEGYRVYINKTLRDGFVMGIWNEQEYVEKVMY